MTQNTYNLYYLATRVANFTSSETSPPRFDKKIIGPRPYLHHYNDRRGVDILTGVYLPQIELPRKPIGIRYGGKYIGIPTKPKDMEKPRFFSFNGNEIFLSVDLTTIKPVAIGEEAVEKILLEYLR